MKRYTLYTFPALALLLAATACTQDDAGTLSDGTQPLTLTAAIEGITDTRATVDNQWNGNETIALQGTARSGMTTRWMIKATCPANTIGQNQVPSPCRVFTRISWRETTTGLGA